MTDRTQVHNQHRPLAPCCPRRARRLLTEGKVALWRRYPFTIILKRAVSEATPEPLRRKLALVAAVSLELVRFDTQLLEHPVISGGSNRVSNLTMACAPCNTAKGSMTAAEFGHPDVQAQARLPFNDAAAVNASRWALYRHLQDDGLPVEVGTGGCTKWNRTQRGLPKAHWIDAVCVVASTPEVLDCHGIVPLAITAMGRHSRQMCRTNAYGFPDKAPKATSVVDGMRTGDLLRAVVPAPSIKAGAYVGRLAVRASGSCNIKTSAGTVQGIYIRYCRPLHRGDGYRYQKGASALPPQA